MEFWTYYRVFRKRYRTVAAAVLVAVVLSLVFTIARVQAEEYNATVTLTTTPPDESRYLLVLITNQTQTPRPDVYKTLAMELIQSRTVAERVIQRLNLELSSQALRFRLRVSGAAGDLLSLSVRDPDRARAILLANTYAEVAVAYNQEVNRRETALAREFIEREIEQTRERLRVAEDVMDEFKRKNGIVAISAQINAEVGRYLDLVNQKRNAALNERELSARTTAIRAQLGKFAPIKIDQQLSENPVAQQLRTQLVNFEVQLVVASATYTDVHPTVIALRQRMKALKEALEREVARVVSLELVQANPIYEGTLQLLIDLETQRVALQARQVALASIVDAEQRKMPALNSLEREFARLAREIQVLESSLGNLETRLNEFRIREQAAMNRNLVYIVDPATSAEPTSRPRVWPRLLLAIMLGLTGGIAIVLFQVYVDNTLKSGKDAERSLGLPVLSTIPRHNPPFDEAYRLLKTNLGMHLLNGTPRAIAFTSAKPGSGTSTIVYYLAKTVGRGGKRVIVVDADLRAPSMTRLFGTNGSAGLLDVLDGAVPVHEALQETGCENVRLLGAGRAGDELADRFSSAEMQQLLQQLRDQADVILIDTPPVIPFAETRALAEFVDGVVFVLSAGQPLRGVEEDAKRHLERSRARILGIVVNKVSPEEDDGYFFYEKYVQSKREHAPASRPRSSRV